VDVTTVCAHSHLFIHLKTHKMCCRSMLDMKCLLHFSLWLAGWCKSKALNLNLGTLCSNLGLDIKLIYIYNIICNYYIYNILYYM
jgi:hypothetical protein